MNLDTTTSFGSIHASGEHFTSQILDVSKLTVLRENTQVWARNLRFLCVPKEFASPSIATNQTTSTAESCQHCQNLAVFSGDNLPYLWLTEYGELPDCVHYIAISYCWKQPPSNELPYKIRTRKGRERDSGAPKEILDRAIKYACENGIRLIWIDTDCIEQNNREDKENGIQSMDLVYSRSLHPLGLLNNLVTKPSQVRGLEFILKRGDQYSREAIHPSFAKTPETEILEIIDALETIAKDSWFTRTWIFHEAVLSSERMDFLMPCERAIQASGHAILTPKDIENFSTGGIHFVTDCLATRSLNTTTKYRLDELHQFFTFRLAVGFESLSSMSNAVAVVNLVSKYHNKRVSDRLAIIANLCGYQVRVRTTEVENPKFSFSTCLLAMSLLNGDISFLQFWHELSRTELSTKEQERNPSRVSGWKTFSWAPSRNDSIEPCHPLTYEAPTRLVGSSVHYRGLAVDGWLWTINQRVDLTALRNRFHLSWQAAIAESKGMHWRDIGDFMRSLFQALAFEPLHHIQNLILRKGWKTVRWHTPHEEEEIPQYATVDEIRSRVFTPSFPLSRQPWSWLIPSIMNTGELYCGGPTNATANRNVRCGIFEYNGNGYFLTPRVRGEREHQMPCDFKDRPNSWLVEPTNETADGRQILVGKGMVRGLWKIGATESRAYIMS